MDIKTFTDNPMLKKIFLKQLKEIVKENKIELITIITNDDGDLDFEVFYEPQKIMPQKDFDKLMENFL